MTPSRHCEHEDNSTALPPHPQLGSTASHDQPPPLIVPQQLPTSTSGLRELPAFQFDDFYQDDYHFGLLLDEDINLWQSLSSPLEAEGQTLLSGAPLMNATCTTSPLVDPAGIYGTLITTSTASHVHMLGHDYQGLDFLVDQPQQQGRPPEEPSSSSARGKAQISIDNIDQDHQLQQMSDGQLQEMMIEQILSHDHLVLKPTSCNIDQGSSGVGSSSMKKVDHNAKERYRRLKLSTSYLALRSLLPESQTAKKRWSEPNIVDRAIEYIPEVESQIEKLKSDKQEILENIGKTNDDQQLRNNQQTAQPDHNQASITVSINEVKRNQVIIQICRPRDDKDILSRIIEQVEDEGMRILNASSLFICEDRSCYNIHVEICETSSIANSTSDDYLQVLKRKVISWLQTY